MFGVFCLCSFPSLLCTMIVSVGVWIFQCVGPIVYCNLLFLHKSWCVTEFDQNRKACRPYMYLSHSVPGPVSQFCCAVIVLKHPSGPGTQWTWDIMGLGHWAWDTVGLVHYEHGTLGLGHCGLGTLWAWYTVGLIHNGTGTRGTTPNNNMKLSVKQRGAKKGST